MSGAEELTVAAESEAVETGAIGARIAEAALALVGAPFRLHGRDPATGLDCIGVAQLALAGAGIAARVRSDYRVLVDARVPVARWARAAGLRTVAPKAARPGDLVIVRPGPAQLHLLVRTAPGHVHAHGGLGRVVHAPGPPPWPVLSVWRAAPCPSLGPPPLRPSSLSHA